MEFKGTVETVTYQDLENGYTVLKVHLSKGAEGLSKSVINRIPVVCNTGKIVKGEEVEFSGELVNHPSYGLQIKASSIKKVLPSTDSGILSLLQAGYVKGIGPKTAVQVINLFGSDTLRVIEQDWERLADIRGISLKKAKQIHDNFIRSQGEEMVGFCCSLGITLNLARRIVNKLGDRTKKIILENPYRLMFLVDGIGFKKADAIAMDCGFTKTSDVRIRAGLTYVLENAQTSGHCGYPREKLIQEMVAVLEVNEDLAINALSAELLDENGNVVKDTIGTDECIFTKGMYYREQYIGNKLLTLLNSKNSFSVPGDLDKLIEKFEDSSRRLAPEQIDAIKLALENNVSVITGGPGVGKTTIINIVLRILENFHATVFLSAPTGRAAKRLSETTGAEARTIHRTLMVDHDGHFTKNETSPLECDVLIVDETSMVDTWLMGSLLKAVEPGTKLILVGDVDQLPSVGAGKVLEDIINSEQIPVARMTKIFRQGKDSMIVTNAHRVNDGVFPIVDNDIEGDFFFVETDNPATAARKIEAMIVKNIPNRWGFDPVKDVQVLCPMKKGVIGTESLNWSLQRLLNPNIYVSERREEILQKRGYKLTIEEEDFMEKYPNKIPVIESFGRKFTIGDKIMQIKNDYELGVFNGDVGYIQDIYELDKTVSIQFENSIKQYSYEQLKNIVLAYATTIHKSQGSEYPVVIVPIMYTHFIMLRRKLLYTALTRGRQLVILVGEKKAVGYTVATKKDDKRYTKLYEWLIENSKKESF